MGDELSHADGQTTRTDMTKLTDPFPQLFERALKCFRSAHMVYLSVLYICRKTNTANISL